MFLHYDDKLRDSPDQLKKLPIQTPEGGTVPLSKVADLEVNQGPITINRSDLMDSISTRCNMTEPIWVPWSKLCRRNWTVSYPPT